MADRKIIEEWLLKADEDFEFASSVSELLDYHDKVCFHYQQSAEKYLKAFIISRGLELRKTHDLSGLLSICVPKEPAMSAIEEDCIFLNRFYIDTRYPVHWPVKYDKKTVSDSKKAAQNIASFVKNALAEKGCA